MPHAPDPDPYADLDYRADAGELSEEFRKPVRVFFGHRRGKPSTQDHQRRNGL